MGNKIVNEELATRGRESCIRCGEPTDILIDTPIDRRKYFVEGAGQMCEKCWIEVYDKETGISKGDDET